ncbi:hypothetical protein [Methylocystis echinoides]|uniref:Transmembrane protein n=1 Tax=Methylocystis echinoides TaxID=29468 RepID=A0A9W6GSU8_9HYPH|nr:hypothetical protein [Methylocystis echinoides]GLI92298.1 hypothetical protein LMG27198_12900 [Methylocystis echinoides]
MNLHSLYADSRERERAFHHVRIASSQSVQTIVDSVLHDMAVLDSKSAALLQFISVVLAALTFALGLVNESAPYAPLIRGGIFVFMGVLGLAAWIDLRCLRSLGPSRALQSTTEFENEMLTEISHRRERYRLALHIAETTFALLALFVLVWMLLARGAHL